MTATLFRLHRLEDGRHAAWALLCLEARYCSLAVPGATALLRRFAPPAEWKEIGLDVSLGLEPGPLPANLPLVRLIAGDQAKSLVTQYVTTIDVAGDPLTSTEQLDATLRAQAAPVLT